MTGRMTIDGKEITMWFCDAVDHEVRFATTRVWFSPSTAQDLCDDCAVLWEGYALSFGATLHVERLPETRLPQRGAA